MISALINKTKIPTSIYKFSPVDSLGGAYSYGRDINDHGQIVGDSYLKNDLHQHAFLAHECKTQDIGAHVFGHHSVAHAINNHNMVAGNYSTIVTGSDHRKRHAFLYDHNNQSMIRLGTLGGESSYAFDINDSNQIIGYSNTAEGNERAFLFDLSSEVTMLALGTLGGLHSAATAINNAGQVVGHSSINHVDTHAFIYQDGEMQDLGTLGGHCSFANDINDHGQVIGSSYDVNENDRAFIYDATKRPCMTDLGTLGGVVSVANGINNLSQVVGYSFVNKDTDAQAFIYENGKMINLNHLLDKKTRQAGWVLNEALAINDNGWVVGIAYNLKANIPSCAFILSIDINASVSYIKFLSSLGLPWPKVS